jgi:hypothetical protein
MLTFARLAPFALAAALPAAAAIPAPDGLARNLQPSADEQASFRLHANGIQVYECRAAETANGGFTWAAVTPDATLYDTASGADIATQKSVNLWESLSDRSSVSGVLRATQASGAGDLPWAYLRAVPTSEEGMFAGVTSIQRVNTRGGAAPASGCAADTLGQEARVPFTAEYYFYKRRGTA